MKKLLYAVSVSLLLLVIPFPAAADQPAARLTAPPFTSYMVNSLADTSDGVCDASNCTLREAITEANTDGTESGVYFQGGLSRGTITLTASLPPLTDPQITAISFTTGLITISGANLHQILTVNAGATAGLRNLTFSNAKSTTGGAAIYNAGTLTILYCQFENNQSTGDGGALYNATPGVVDMDVAIFNGNKGSRGGAIRNASSVNNSGAGTMNIHYAWFQGNQATNEGGVIYNGGGAYTDLHVYESIFMYNTSGKNGGVIYQGSGAAMVENNTIVRNSALNGAALSNGGGALSVRNSTISANSASAGGSVHNGSGSLNVRNTIIANQMQGTNCSGTITNAGNNIDNLASCGWGSANGSRSNTDPLLAPLAYYNSGIETMMPLPNSPAIDGVIYNPLDCPATDQRGVTRPIDGNHDGTALCDIGSHEFDLLRRNFLPWLIR